MKIFIKKCIILSIPVMLWIAIVFIIDPFNYFNIVHLIASEIKIKNARTINTLFYHTFQFVNSPCPNILIGDSRTAGLPLEEINDMTGEKYKLLTANALKINEIADLFWLANSYEKLRKVYIGINFSMFNAYAYADRVNAVKTILENPLRYIFNTNTAEALFYVIKASIIQKPVIDSIPPLTREEFWDYIVRVRGNDWYSKYKFPKNIYEEMKKIVDFCKKHDINLTFIIVPHHVEFQSRLWEYKVIQEKVHFLKSMLELNVRVIDYDYINEITLDKNNFSDPVHYNEKMGTVIAHEIWKGPYRIGKVLDREYVEYISTKELNNKRPDALATFSN